MCYRIQETLEELLLMHSHQDYKKTEKTYKYSTQI